MFCGKYRDNITGHRVELCPFLEMYSARETKIEALLSRDKEQKYIFCFRTLSLITFQILHM